MTTLKYLRALIKLGDLDLEVFQLPDCSYLLSQKQVFAAVEFDPKNLPRFLRSRGLETISCMGLNLPRFSVNGGSVQPMTLEQAVIIWTELATTGNQRAKALLFACATETIERRADAAFGVQRSEQERNERLVARQKGIKTRREVTDAVQDYLERSGSSEIAAKWAYSNVTNAMYRAVFDMTATELEVFLGCARNQSRNFLEMKSLRAIEFAENLICRLIDDRGMEPMEAVSQAVEMAAIKPMTPKPKEVA